MQQLGLVRRPVLVCRILFRVVPEVYIDVTLFQLKAAWLHDSRQFHSAWLSSSTMPDLRQKRYPFGEVIYLALEGELEVPQFR